MKGKVPPSASVICPHLSLHCTFDERQWDWSGRGASPGAVGTARSPCCAQLLPERREAVTSALPALADVLVLMERSCRGCWGSGVVRAGRCSESHRCLGDGRRNRQRGLLVSQGRERGDFSSTITTKRDATACARARFRGRERLLTLSLP